MARRLIADSVLSIQICDRDPINTDPIFTVWPTGAEVKAIVANVEQCGPCGKLNASEVRTGGRENVIRRSLSPVQRRTFTTGTSWRLIPFLSGNVDVDPDAPQVIAEEIANDRLQLWYGESNVRCPYMWRHLFGDRHPLVALHGTERHTRVTALNDEIRLSWSRYDEPIIVRSRRDHST